MIKNRSGFSAFLALLFILSAPGIRAQVSTAAATSVAEAPAAGAPTLAVQDLIAEARQYADVNAAGISAEEKQRRLAVKDRMSGILDLREMAHLILIKPWGKLTPAERDNYSGLLTKLVEKIAYPQIEKYFNGDLVINYEGETVLAEGGTGVLTKIIDKDEDLTLSTEFRLRRTDAGWRIYDVISDGESLLLIYRNQHMGIIKEKGFPHLVKLMEKKLNAK